MRTWAMDKKRKRFLVRPVKILRGSSVGFFLTRIIGILPEEKMLLQTVYIAASSVKMKNQVCLNNQGLWVYCYECHIVSVTIL